MRERATGRVHGDDAGFTLVELVLTIAILGIVLAPLAGVIMTFMKNSDATAARMNESHDAQSAAAYFAQDVQSVGVRDHSDPSTLDKPLVQSVELNAPAGTGMYPCGPAGTPDAVVRLAWDDYLPSGATISTTPTVTRVAYVMTGTQLRRLTCVGSSTPASDVVVARNLVAATASCSTDCTGTGTAVPSAVSLTLTVRDPKSAGDYSVTLTGHRRQS